MFRGARPLTGSARENQAIPTTSVTSVATFVEATYGAHTCYLPTEGLTKQHAMPLLVFQGIGQLSTLHCYSQNMVDLRLI